MSSEMPEKTTRALKRGTTVFVGTTSSIVTESRKVNVTGKMKTIHGSSTSTGVEWKRATENIPGRMLWEVNLKEGGGA